MDTDYREEYRMYSTSELRKIAASDSTIYPIEAIEAARAELTSRGGSDSSEPGLPPIAGVSKPHLSDLARQYLDQTRPWVLFLSIMMFIGAAFLVLVSFGMMAVGLAGGLGLGRGTGLGGQEVAALGIVYGGLACLYIAPGVFLYRYASAIRALKAVSTAEALENALRHQKSFWRYVGILSAVALCLAALAVVLGIVIGIMGSAIGGLR